MGSDTQTNSDIQTNSDTQMDPDTQTDPDTQMDTIPKEKTHIFIITMAPPQEVFSPNA